MIEARWVTKSFDGKTVLSGVSRNFAPGSVTCIEGPSGCGKTTFLNILMGLVKPDGGTVSGVPDKKAAVFQDDRLLGTLTTSLNAGVAMDKTYTQNDVIEHLKILGLADSLRTPAASLSGGMKKRLGIARAVLSKPDVLFLDEPFNGLDDEAKEKACDYIKRFAGGATVIMVTHSRAEALMMKAEIFTLSGGAYELD